MDSNRLDFPIESVGGEVVVFDLDKTLTDRDTVSRFILRWLITNQLFKRSLAVAGEGIRYVAHRDRIKLRSRVTEIAFNSEFQAKLDAVGQAFAAKILENYLRPNVVKFAHQLKESGAQILLVTSAYESYAHPLAKELGFVGCLGTQIEFNTSQQAVGLRGVNCWGPEKMRRYREWADSNSKGNPLLAVGDSQGDQELWDASQFKIRVTRNGSLVTL